MSSKPAQDGTENGTGRHRMESKATIALRKLLPRGIRIGTWGDDAHQAKPYFVRYGPERTVKSFEVESTRNTFAEDLINQTARLGSTSLQVKHDELTEWSLFKAQTQATMAQVWEAWRRYKGQLTLTLTVSEAVGKYLALRLSEDIAEKTNTYRQMKRHLKDVLAATHGERRLVDITAEDLRGLLATVKDRDGEKPAAAITKKSYRKNWNTFFNRACAEKWLETNPCAEVVPPKVVAKEKELLSIENAFRFLQTNIKEPVLPRIALEMWGFMRASGAGRVLQKQVVYEDKGLRMPGKQHKGGKWKYRQGHADVLWDWLALATEETWALDEKMYAVRKAQAFTRAGLKITERASHNILRHSCISYNLAATKDLSRTSYLAQHSSLKMTEEYEGVATEKDGKLWAKLTPKAVTSGSFEQFITTS